MKALLIFIISLVFTNLAIAQVVEILNQETSETIAYANIIYLQKGQIQGGTYSNENGQATIVFTAEVDSVEISCLGFETKKITAKNLPKTIFLESSIELLDEVAVYSNADAPLLFLGFDKELGAQSTTAFKGFQIITFIENSFQEEKRIKSFQFQIKKGRTDNDAKLKVILF